MKGRLAYVLLSVLLGCKTDPLPCPMDCSPSDFPPGKKVLIIGLDGCRTDAMLQAQTPVLDSLAASGRGYVNVNRGPHTVSAPGWSAILTGVWSDKHGVTDNSYDGSNFEQYPDIFTRLKTEFPCGKLYYSNSHPIVSKGMLGMADYGIVTNDDAEAAKEAVRQLTYCQPDVLFIHLDEIDHQGHSSGFSPENEFYVDQIEKADLQIRQILNAFQTSFAGDEWLIWVVTDHGGEGHGHGGQDDNLNVTEVFLTGSSNASVIWKDTLAEVVDLVPSTFGFLGVPIDTSWALDGKSLLN